MLCNRTASWCTLLIARHGRCRSFLLPSSYVHPCLNTTDNNNGQITRWQNYVFKRHAHSKSLKEAQNLAASGTLDSSEDSAVAKSVPHEHLISGLQDCTSVEEQMRKLSSMLRLSPEDIKERLTIADMVDDMLKPFFSNYKVQLFGSTVNSFGFKGCDIDMVFNTGGKYDEKMSISNDDSYIPSIADVLEGRSSPEYMSKLAFKDQLIFVHTVFLDYYKFSATPPMYINAYVPIIRFVYDKYQLKCDLSTGNWSAIVNTKLLYAFNELDDRVGPLVMAIRYWGKHSGLIGGGLMFNTYCITLLLIYFLQTRSPPVLPSADYLISQIECLKSDIVMDEDVLREIRKLPRSKNTQSVEELLREFFLYYLYFDFTRVICPKTAKTASRDEFASANKRFKLNTICVQDPIKLTHNVSNLVDYRNCKKFAKEMLYASKLFQDKSTWIPKSSPWGLIALFDKQFNLNSMIEDKNSWTFQIPVKSTSYAASESEKYAQLLKAAETVVKLLEQGLLFKCQVLRMEDRPKDASINSENCGKLLFKASCLGEYNTWLGRSSVDIENISSESVKDILELERLVSLKLSKRVKEDKKTVFRFVCKFYALEIEDVPSLHVTMSSESEHNFSPILGIFLKEYLPNLMMKLL